MLAGSKDLVSAVDADVCTALHLAAITSGVDVINIFHLELEEIHSINNLTHNFYSKLSTNVQYSGQEIQCSANKRCRVVKKSNEG